METILYILDMEMHVGIKIPIMIFIEGLAEAKAGTNFNNQSSEAKCVQLC